MKAGFYHNSNIETVISYLAPVHAPLKPEHSMLPPFNVEYLEGNKTRVYHRTWSFYTPGQVARDEIEANYNHRCAVIQFAANAPYTAGEALAAQILALFRRQPPPELTVIVGKDTAA